MSVNIHTIKDIRIFLLKELNKIYQEPETSSLINIIIKTVTGASKLHQLYNSDEPVSKLQVEKIIEISNELKTGKPVQYILGETDFFGCIIKLNSQTLIPRQETEELVHLIISENKNYRGKIIDLGSGSGCIAIALAANIPGSSVTGIDISESAVSIAGENALLNGVNVSFLKSDIFTFNDKTVGKAGIIVSNPPYVRDSEKKSMNRNVLDFEPHRALFVPDSNPLMFYNAIIKAAETILLPGGRLYFEINEVMGPSMIKLLGSAGYRGINVIKDINDKDRIVKGIKDA
jgi:release factor glutamine methyltransferase